MYITQPKEVLEARPASIRFAKEIAAFANKKFEGKAGAMGSLIAALTLQNIVTSLLVEVYMPGSEDGQRYLEKMYDELKRDALTRWHQDDLKHHFAGKHRKKS